MSMIEAYSLWERSLSHTSEEERKVRVARIKERMEQFENGTYVPKKPHLRPGTERLAYYRSHGLTDCSDYPGGDAQFEKDVLSGEYRHEKPVLEPIGREDAYIIKCLKTGRLKVDWAEFWKYGVRPEVDIAARDSCGGCVIHRSSDPSYTYAKYREEVLSGEYAKNHLDVKYYYEGEWYDRYVGP